ncbi:hypothetical protein GN956_G20509 [Arapaima gigas]
MWAATLPFFSSACSFCLILLEETVPSDPLTGLLTAFGIPVLPSQATEHDFIYIQVPQDDPRDRKMPQRIRSPCPTTQPVFFLKMSSVAQNSVPPTSHSHPASDAPHQYRWMSGHFALHYRQTLWIYSQFLVILSSVRDHCCKEKVWNILQVCMPQSRLHSRSIQSGCV